MKNRINLSMALAAVAAVPVGMAVAQGALSSERDYGINAGRLNISPYVSAGVFYDDNPDFVRKGEKGGKFGTEEEYDSFGYRIRPGVDLKLPGNDVNLTGNAFYSLERYEEDFMEDRDEWGESLGFSYNAPRDLDFKLNEHYRYVREQDEDSVRWDDRYEMGVGGSVHKGIGEKTDVTVSGNYSELDYDSETLYDWHRYGVGAALSRAVTEKMNAKITGRYSGSESDRQDGTADTWTGLIGVSSRATDKISYDLNVGFHQYTGFKGDNSKTTVAYSGDVKWAPTDKFNVSLNGSSEFHPSEDEALNSIRSYRVGLGASYRPVERWLFTSRLSLRQQDYTKPVKEGSGTLMSSGIIGRHRRDNYYTFSVGASFMLTKNASLNGNFIYSFDDSTISDYEYDRWRATLGITLRY